MAWSAARNRTTETSDPVLAPLKLVEQEYRAVREEMDQLRSQNEELGQQLEAVRERAALTDKRARRLAESIKRIHGALFHGSVPEMVLRASIGLTGATRGVYVTARGTQLHVRAAVGIGSPGTPSPFITALCQKAIEQQDTIVCNDPDGPDDLPESSEEESFRNCAAVPVMLMQNLDGVIIVADKADGEFDEDDVEAVMSVGDQAKVAVSNFKLERELQSAYLSTVSMLADVVEAKDPYTRGHCEAASRYARMVANELNLTGPERDSLCYAALLHDVGKIGITDGILNKPGPLLPEERQLVQAHVRIGYDLIRSVPVLENVAEIVLHHHEHYDGNGYPSGLQGEDIPMASRIVAVVDSWCAMLDERSYKEPYTKEYARAELQRCAGTQFDPRVVDAFLLVVDTPNAIDTDDDHFAECGPLPTLMRLDRLRIEEAIAAN